MAWSFGGELRKEQTNNDLSGGSRPLYTFAGLFNFANDAPLFYQINADPRTGGPAQSQRYFRTSTSAFFAQNDWKVRPNLSRQPRPALGVLLAARREERPSEQPRPRPRRARS